MCQNLGLHQHLLWHHYSEVFVYNPLSSLFGSSRVNKVAILSHVALDALILNLAKGKPKQLSGCPRLSSHSKVTGHPQLDVSKLSTG
jgi:hypothetical protein